MTTHRRGWLLRTGLVALLTAGGLAVVATPALADDTLGVSVTPLPDFNAGQTQTLHVKVTYKKPLVQSDNVTVTINQLNNVTVSDAQKTVTISAGNNPADVTFDVKASSNVPVGQSVNGSGKITIADDRNNDDTTQFQATIHGPDAAPSPTPRSVPRVTGTVKDRSTGAAVADAQVSMQDDEQHTFTTGTDRNGTFRFESTEAKPISPGTLAFVVTKDGYDQRSTTVDARAGQVLNVPIVLAATAGAASASAAPSDSTSPSPVDSPGAVVAPTVGAAEGSGGGGFSSLLIVIGAILVLLGIGAIALILWRRKADNNPPEDDEVPGPPRRGPTTGPASRGAYRGAPPDATSVLPGGGYGAPTAAGRPLADAPTMMHRPVADEYPDPYGAPDPRTTAQYGPPTQYQPSGGYGAPTGVFPTSGGPYPPGGFGSPAGNPGYTDPTRHAPPVSGGGYGGQGGYDSQPPASGYPRPADPYGTTHTQSHDSGGDNYSSGYSQGGYGNDDEPRGGYQPREGYQPRGGGYQQPPRGGYDTPPEHRRSLDWLDD